MTQVTTQSQFTGKFGDLMSNMVDSKLNEQTSAHVQSIMETQYRISAMQETLIAAQTYISAHLKQIESEYNLGRNFEVYNLMRNDHINDIKNLAYDLKKAHENINRIPEVVSVEEIDSV